MQGRMDVDDTNFQNISAFSMTFDDYICPITGQFYFDPKQVLPCGHIFESSAIEKWLKAEPDNNCPCCREKITKTFPAPYYFKKHYAELLEKKPELHGERYFDWGNFIASQKMENDFNKYIELFKKIPSYLNVICDEKKSDKNSVVLILSKSQKGREFLEQSLNNLSVKALNHVNVDGESAIYYLIKSHSHIVDDPYFHTKIAVESLNSTLATDEEADYSTLYWLTQSVKGRELLINHPELRSQITARALNHIIENQGISPLFCLMQHENGRALIESDAKLRNKISSTGLNSVILQGETPGVTSLYYLATSANGILLLEQDAKLRGKVTQEGMNSYPIIGENSGMTVAVKFIINEDGLALLNKNPQLRKKINKEGINTREQGENCGATGVYWLLKHKVGRQILRKDARLRGLIQRESLHHVITEGPEKGKSAAFWLKKCGQLILKLDSGLKKKLLPEVKASSSQFFKNGKKRKYELKEPSNGRLTRKK